MSQPDGSLQHKYAREKLVSLILELDGVRSSRLLRRFGFFDTKIMTLVSSCRSTLHTLGQLTPDFERTLLRVSTNPDTRRLLQLRELLVSSCLSILQALPQKSPTLERFLAEVSTNPTTTSLSNLRTSLRLEEPQMPRSATETNVNVLEAKPGNESLGCFVMMPFSHDFDDIYNAVVRGLHRARCMALRSDETELPGMISEQILKSIRAARFCLADISGGNPNVMYELGVAHALEKTTILMSRDPQDAIPIDVRNFRRIEYVPTKLDSLQIEIERVARTITLPRA